jgi:hypothetical protein
MDQLSTRQRTGLVLAGLYGVLNIPSVLAPQPEGGEGPPLAVLLVDSLLGVVVVAAAVVAWRSGSRAAIRVVAGSLVIIAITALPAFFVDVPASIKLLVAVGTVMTIAIVVLLFSPVRRSAPLLEQEVV